MCVAAHARRCAVTSMWPMHLLVQPSGPPLLQTMPYHHRTNWVVRVTETKTAGRPLRGPANRWLTPTEVSPSCVEVDERRRATPATLPVTQGVAAPTRAANGYCGVTRRSGRHPCADIRALGTKVARRLCHVLIQRGVLPGVQCNADGRCTSGRRRNPCPATRQQLPRPRSPLLRPLRPGMTLRRPFWDRPGEVLVGHQACLGHGGGHTTWTCQQHATRPCTGATQHPPHDTRRTGGSEPPTRRSRRHPARARHPAWWRSARRVKRVAATSRRVRPPSGLAPIVQASHRT
jgi:hypothetical protein